MACLIFFLLNFFLEQGLWGVDFPTPIKNKVRAEWSLWYCYKIPDVGKWFLLYSIKLYIFIITSMYLALSTCFLLISLMQSVNGTHCLNIASLFLLFGAVVVTVFGTILFPLPTMHAWLYEYNINSYNINIVILKWIWLLA